MAFATREAAGVSAQNRFEVYMRSRGFEVVPNGQEKRLTPDQMQFVGQFDDPLSTSIRFAEDLIMFRRDPVFAPALFEVKTQLRRSKNFAVDAEEWREMQRRAFIYHRVAIVGGRSSPGEPGFRWFAEWVVNLPDFEIMPGSDRGSGRPYVLVPINRMYPIYRFIKE